MLPGTVDFRLPCVHYLTGDIPNVDFVDLGTDVSEAPAICNDEN